MVWCLKNITLCYLYCVIPGCNIVQSGRMLPICVVPSNMLQQASEYTSRRQYMKADSW
jgi:hypothetical protein